MDLDGGEIHNGGRLKGWALKSRLFWVLKWQRAVKPMRIHPDPDPVQTLPPQKDVFFMKNVVYVGYRTTYKVINHTYAGTKAF